MATNKSRVVNGWRSRKEKPWCDGGDHTWNSKVNPDYCLNCNLPKHVLLFIHDLEAKIVVLEASSSKSVIRRVNTQEK